MHVQKYYNFEIILCNICLSYLKIPYSADQGSVGEMLIMWTETWQDHLSLTCQTLSKYDALIPVICNIYSL